MKDPWEVPLSALEKDLEEVCNNLAEELERLIKKLNRKRGVIEASAYNYNYLSTHFRSLVQELEELGFTDIAKQYSLMLIDVSPDLVKNVSNYCGLSISMVDKSMIESLAKLGHEGMMHLGMQNLSLIRSNVISYVLAGGEESEIIAKIRRDIEAKFKRYATTYLWTSVHLYNQKINDITIEKAGIKPEDMLWRYVGVLDNKNRPECRWARLKDIFTYKERKEFEEKYGLRWNCRHTFFPIPPDKIDKEAE
ncbi:MAG: hypothetical protein RBR14_06555 [Candidatus Cloacimonas acidaminovorans]|nr:hypothetical protein [Candidatus Cloacimonas acidaminovorans]